MTMPEAEDGMRKPVDLDLTVEEGGNLWLQITLSTGERWRLSLPRATVEEALVEPRPSSHQWNWQGHVVVVKATARVRSLFERGRFRCKYDTWARMKRPPMDRDNVWTCECKLCTTARLMHRSDAPPPRSPEDAEKVRVRIEALRWRKPSAESEPGVGEDQQVDDGSQG